MNNKNKIKNTIIILALLLVGSFIVYGIIHRSKTAIDDKIVSTSENAKTETSDLIASIEKKAKTNYALIKVKVTLLKSQIALKIDKSEQKAEAELDNAINYLSEAKSTADEKTKAEIDLLKTKVNTAKKSVVQKKYDALENVTAAFDDAKTLSEKYNDKFQAEKEKHIATVNSKYDDLRAEEALLKAKIAAQSEKTYSQAQAYLEEANEWYIRSKEFGTQEIKLYKEQIQKDIADAQFYLEKKDKEARNKIADILEKAKEFIKED